MDSCERGIDEPHVTGQSVNTVPPKRLHSIAQRGSDVAYNLKMCQEFEIPRESHHTASLCDGPERHI